MDWEETGEGVRTELLERIALNITREDGAHLRAGWGGTVPLFHHHSVDDTVFLRFGHSGLNQRQIRVSKQSFCGYFNTYYKLFRLRALLLVTMIIARSLLESFASYSQTLD